MLDDDLLNRGAGSLELGAQDSGVNERSRNKWKKLTTPLAVAIMHYYYTAPGTATALPLPLPDSDSDWDWDWDADCDCDSDSDSDAAAFSSIYACTFYARHRSC